MASDAVDAAAGADRMIVADVSGSEFDLGGVTRAGEQAAATIGAVVEEGADLPAALDAGLDQM